MYSLAVITVVLALITVNYCNILVTRDGDKPEARPTELSGRTPPLSFAMETFLQYILRNDEQKCMLKLVCTVGANATRYGTYGDAIASYFGYEYNPHDFSVVEKPFVLDVLGRPAGFPQAETNSNNTLPEVLNQNDIVDTITKETDPELFGRMESTSEARTGFPAATVFNRAFVLGLKSGLKPCADSFPNCTMNIDMLVNFGITMFQRPLGSAQSS